MSYKIDLSEDEIIERKLHLFINKYYRIKFYQGLLITLSASLIIIFCLLSFGNTELAGKSIINLVKIIGAAVWLAVLAMTILKPLAQRLGIIKGLNFKDASRIISQKHQSIEDRIINVIELTREKAGKDNALYDYAIAQKTDHIRDFNFNEAISVKKLGSFLFRLAVIVALCAITVIFWPGFVKKGIGQMWSGTRQIAELNKTGFVILNDSLKVESGKDFLLRFKIVSVIPAEQVIIKMGASEEKAGKVKDGYEFLFKAVNSAVFFRLSCDGSDSEEYELKTLNRPEIASLQLKVIPPSYTGIESMVIDGDGNAEVPSGSTVIWNIKTVHTDELIWSDIQDSLPLKGNGNNWKTEKRIVKPLDYELISRNANGLSNNYIYRITLVSDLYPTIDIADSRDSTISKEVYIQGVIQDDYGFSKLEIVESRSGREQAKVIKINANNIYESFYYSIIPDSINTEYFFRVWDNDRVAGPKFTESRKIVLKTRSKIELENLNNKLVDSIKTNMQDGMDAIEKMEKKISEFKIDQVAGELKPWEIQEKLKELTGLKEQVIDFLNNINNIDKEFTENENILNQDDELNKKAREIQELMQSLMDDELKDLLKQFEELSKEFNSKMADELTEKMALNLDKLKEQMEMSLELLKKYDLEKELLKQAEQLNQMADSLQKDKNQEEGSGNKLKEEFKKWEEQYKKNLEQDQQFKKPMGLKDLENERDEVRKAAEDLNKKESGKEVENRKSRAAKGLKNLSKKMNEMMGAMSGGGESVDLEDLRQIRNSLNDFSKKQEELNGRISNIMIANPAFTSVIKEQKVLEAKFISIRDSLNSLGYKQPVIAKMTGDELFHVETSLKNLFDKFEDKQVSVVRIEQNRIMSEINSIAVKLDELIKSLENVKGGGKGGESEFSDRKKKNEGEQSGSEKMGEAKSKQESLKEQLKSSIQKMKSGQGGKKERGEMGKMLAEREMMRKAFEKMLQEGGLGTDAKQKANEALKMMEDVEKDIIYNRLNEKTLDKDNLITTRLLEAENAEKERENENRRESKEFKGTFAPNKLELNKATEQNKALEQMIKYNELKLKRFYQEKYQNYIESTKK